MILGVTASDTSGSLAELKRLNDLRGSIGGGWADLLDQDRPGPPDTHRRRKATLTPEEES